MKDQQERAELDKEYFNKIFEEIIKRKGIKCELTVDAAYRDIIRSSTTTNFGFDRKAGLNDEGERKT